MRGTGRRQRKCTMRSFRNRFVGMVLAVLMLVLQVGCGAGTAGEQGKSEQTLSGGSGNQSTMGEILVKEETDSEYVFVPKEIVWGDMWWSLMEARVEQDMLCYSSGLNLVYNALTGGGTQRKALTWADAPESCYINKFCSGADGSIYVFAEAVVNDAGANYLCIFDKDGNYVSHGDMTEFMDVVGEVMDSQWKMAVDSEGRTYLATDTEIGLFDKDGKYQGLVSFDNASIQITGIARGKDGKVYAAYHRGALEGSYIGAISFEEKKPKDAEKVMHVKGLSVGIEKELLAYTEDKVYEYDLSANTLSCLFKWEDCNVNGKEVTYLDVLSDGRLVAVESSSATASATAITGMSAAEAAALNVERQEIRLGFSSSSLSKDLAQAVVRFNKENEKYKVVTVKYDGDGDLQAGRERMLAEIVAGEGPDLVILDYLNNVDSLVEKGVFDELDEYLEKSEKYAKEDFIDRLVELGTYNGKLVAIPHAFTLYTYMGSKNVVGEEPGWTLEEMLAVMEANPDKELLYGARRLNLLGTFLSFNEDSFLDWEKGVCSFNSPEFITLLEVVNKFPENNDSIGMGKPSLVTKVTNREVILADIYLNGFNSLQPYCDIFAEGYTCIGYPNNKGAANRADLFDMLAINSQSKVKDGAWEFLEYFYSYRRKSGRNYFSFPCLKSQLTAQAEECTNEEIKFKTVHSYTDGVTYEERHPTKEEVEVVYQLIDSMQPVGWDLDLLNIIKEEAGAYFSGQKSVETVAEIIQNRIQNYMDENK